MTRIAMIGAGSVGRRHAEVLTGLDGVDVVTVTDPVAEAAQTFADGVGATACATAEEALDAGVDAAYVCVPPFAHGPAEEAVLERGLPLFVEKPIGLDPGAAEQIAERIEAAGVVTGTGYHWRCLDTAESARDLLRDSAPALAMGYWLDKRPPVAWWGRMDRSGGQVVEQLTHVIDMARFLLGEVVEVYAMGVSADGGGFPGAGPDDVDLATAATMRFESGAAATLAATSALTAKHRAGIDVLARGLLVELSEATLVVDDGNGRVSYDPGVDPRLVVDAEFVAAVRGELESTRAPYAEALRSHRVSCALVESATTGRPVQVAR